MVCDYVRPAYAAHTTLISDHRVARRLTVATSTAHSLAYHITSHCAITDSKQRQRNQTSHCHLTDWTVTYILPTPNSPQLLAMFAFVATLVLLAAAVVHAHPVTLRRGAVAAHGWTVHQAASSSDRVHFHLALPQRNLDVLDRKFWAVSNPDSDEYGQFLSVDDIQALVSPPLAARSDLIHYLVQHGVEDAAIKDFGDSLEVDATVDIASALFDATFHVFQHAESGRRVVRASSDVSVSVELAQRIESVYGLTGFPVPHFRTHTRLIGDDPTIENDAIIPQSLYAMYGLPRNTTVDNSDDSGISQGVIEWEGESFRPIDLLYYATNTSLNGQPVYPDEQIVGNNPQSGGGESTLDVDMIVGVAPGNSNWFWLEDNQTTWLYGFTVHFLNATTVPDVISVSYGWYEGGQCDDGIGGAECEAMNITASQFVQRVNTQWQKIGLRGVSTFISSGDSGCHTRSDEACQSPTLLADYPSSSPYITSVGATQVQNDTFFPQTTAPVCRARDSGMDLLCISGGVEVAVDVSRSYFTSGGGFSNISKSMDYQTAAVQAYLSQTDVPLPPFDMFNQRGRAYPDVSAVGHNGYILIQEQETLEGGTSQSSPIFAGVAALLNVEYKKITGNGLGFMNPLLVSTYLPHSTVSAAGCLPATAPSCPHQSSARLLCVLCVVSTRCGPTIPLRSTTSRRATTTALSRAARPLARDSVPQ